MELVIDGRSVRVATGGRTHDGDETAVVFVHGSGSDRTNWQLQTRWFAHHGYRTAAVDLPGHGGSQGPPLTTIAEMAEWLLAAIETMGLAPAHLVGHSMGTFVAIETAARHPESVRSIVLLGTAAIMRVNPELLTAALADDPKAARLITSWGVGSRARRGGHASPGRWLIGGNIAQIDRTPPGSLATDLVACQEYDRAIEAATEVRCPVTILLGRDDKMTPVKAAAGLIEAFDEPRTVYLDDVGHFMAVEAPVVTRRVIADAMADPDRT